MSGLRARVWMWSLALRNELPWRRPTMVEAGIWVGGVPTLRRWRWLRGHGVSRFISLFGEVLPPAWLADAEDGLWLKVPDRSAPSTEDIERACHFIDESRSRGAGVYVFCGSGMGRAPTAYLAWQVRGGIDVGPALARLQELRSVVSPTAIQREALVAWATRQSKR